MVRVRVKECGRVRGYGLGLGLGLGIGFRIKGLGVRG